MPGVSFKEMLVRLGALRVVDPMVDLAYANVLRREFIEQTNDSPHGRPWHTSFHASSFPGDAEQACGRAAVYGLMDIPHQKPADRWLATVAEVGKAVELSVVRKVRDAGMLVVSGQEGRSSDPDALDEHGMPAPQMGFADPEHWLTGSVDLPMLPLNYVAPHIVEIKSKHESQIEQMQMGDRGPDEKHRRQLLCSLGLAHEHPDDFRHPTTFEPLPPAEDGSIYYVSRDELWPGPVKTFEFFFNYNASFMEQGRAHLKEWRRAFLEDELPQPIPRKNARSHPYGWKWSEGVCRYCALKRVCKADYNSGVTKISKSHGIAAAKFTRPGYDPAAKRAAVLSAWGETDPLARQEDDQGVGDRGPGGLRAA